MTPAQAPKPAISLLRIITLTDFPTGLIAFQRIYHVFPATQIHFRPCISEIAATTKGPKAMPRKYVEKISCADDMPMCKSDEMSFSAAEMMLAVMSVIS